MSVQAMWSGAGVAAGLAIFAGWRDRRRRLRSDPDRVGWIDWITIQAGALIALGVIGYFAVMSR